MVIRALSLVVLVGCLAVSSAQDKKEPPKKAPASVFTNATEAGPDYLIQGEYEGKLGSDKAGAQVVALGDGKFDVFLLAGGLPGAGWNAKDKVKAEAGTTDGKATLTGKFTGSLAEGKLNGKTPDGVEFSLVKVERKSPTLGAKAADGALILFDGKNADEWAGGKIVESDLLAVGTNSKKGIGAGKLHLEFRTPFQPKARGQSRGNSGVYLHNTEIQVLDSFGLTGANNECGAFYSRQKPEVNMCLPPLTWQTYDVELKSEGEQLLATVFHNGVKVHENFVIRKGPVKPANIQLQNHGNPVAYRNIWFVEPK